MWKYSELTYYIASLYPREDDIEKIIKNAGLKRQFLRYSPRPINFWTNIIEYVVDSNKLRNLIDAILRDDNEDDPYLLAFRDDENTDFKSPFSNKKLDTPTEPTKAQLEQLTMGGNTILPISFLSEGIEKSKSVVKITTPRGSGTGFIIANNYVLTNHHVIGSADVAAHSKTSILCNYEEGKNEETFRLLPNSDKGFVTSAQNDWSIIKIDTTGDGVQDKLLDYGFLNLEKIEMEKGEFVNIIQHPRGNRKQIALYHNLITSVEKTRVLYMTDTLPGASGSPVFNTYWEVVALHHAGRDVKVKDSDKLELMNEGININVIIDEIAPYLKTS